MSFRTQFSAPNHPLEQEISGSWVSLLLLEPTGVIMVLNWKNRNISTLPPSVSLISDDLWHEYTLTANLGTPTKLTASLWLESGINTELRDVQWKQDHQPQNLLVEPFRSVLWFGYPNYAGHSLAAFVLFIVFLTPNIWLGVVAAILGLMEVYFTESRAAWFALGIGIPYLFGFILSQRQCYWFFGIVFVLVIAGLSTRGNEILGRLATVDQSEVTRQSIWKVAVPFILEHPWGNSSTTAFTEAYTQDYPKATEKITHAHNFWLQMGVRYGVTGLLVSVLFGFVLIRFFWLCGGWKALGFLLPILGMNFVDYSLDYAGVSIPLVVCAFWVFIVSKNKNLIPKSDS